MNKKWFSVVAMLALVLFLAACTGKEEVHPETTVAAEIITVETTVSTETVEDTHPEETFPVETEYTGPAAGSLTYEEYLAMPVEDQEKYYDQFASFDDFMNWQKTAEDVYLSTEATFSDDKTVIEEGLEDW